VATDFIPPARHNCGQILPASIATREDLPAGLFTSILMRIRPFPNSLSIVCVVVMAILVLVPIFVLGIPHGADLPNHYRFVLPFYESIGAGSWYPGWLAESNAGYGDPRFRFYPPGLYYGLVLFRTIAGSWYVGSLGTFALISIAGGLGLYLWTRELSTNNVAMWAGILYALNPYRLNEIYQASLLSEYAACSVLPFAFAFTERVCRKGRASDVAGLACSFACLVLTHVPLTVIGSLSLLIYSLFRLERANLVRTVVKLTAGVSLGLAASAFFWSTVIAELSWIKGSSVDPNLYYDYRVNFVFSPSALTNRNTWLANILGLAVLGFMSPAIVLLKREHRARVDKGLKAVFILALVSFFMTTELSRPIWAIVPKLREVQFPWRWLAITSMSGCVLLAVSIPKWLQQRKSDLRPRDLLAPVALALSLVFVVGHVFDSVYLGKQEFETLLPDIRGAVSFKDWLPAAAREVRYMNKMNDRVEAASRRVQINLWQPEHRQFQLSGGPATDARARTYFYPLWKASSNGKSLVTQPADDGALLVQVPADTTNVELSFQEPSRVRVVRGLSWFGWILIIAAFMFDFIRRLFSRRQLTSEVN
jgi:6-pyruvoyl-tetrahydropterin synthase related domain